MPDRMRHNYPYRNNIQMHLLYFAASDTRQNIQKGDDADGSALQQAQGSLPLYLIYNRCSTSSGMQGVSAEGHVFVTCQYNLQVARNPTLYFFRDGLHNVYVSVPLAAGSEGLGLRPLACWDCGFQSHRGQHGWLYLASVVCCQVEVSASG